MSKFIGAIALCLFVQGFAIVCEIEEKKVPTLNAATLAALAPPLAEVARPVAQKVETCFEGTTPRADGSCVKKIFEDPLPESGEVIVPYLVSCPPGFKEANGACSRVVEGPPAYFCLKGWTDDGNSCLLTVPGEVVPQCLKGQLVEGSCVTTERLPYDITPTCPEGAKVGDDGNCWKIIDTFDCTPRAHPIVGRVIGVEPESPIPLGERIIVPRAPTESVAVSEQEICEILPSYQPRALHGVCKGCVGGKKLRGFLGAPIPAAPVRVVPIPSPSKILHIPAAPVTHIISNPRNTVEGYIVKEKERRPPVKVPAPIKEEEEICEAELISVTPPHAVVVEIESQRCARKEVVPSSAVVSCPEGFTDSGHDCVKISSSAPVNLCLTTGSTTVPCPPSTKRTPKYAQCLDGSPPIDGKCKSTEIVPAALSCAEGFKDTGNGCCGTVSTGCPRCREGFELQGDVCVGEVVLPSVTILLEATPAPCEPLPSF